MDLNTIVKIFYTRCQERSAEETDKVKRHLLGMKFAKALNLKEKHITDMLPNFRTSTAQRDQVVIRFGEIGENFYVLLKGRYSVWIPVQGIKIQQTLQTLIDSCEDTKKTVEMRAMLVKRLSFQFRDPHFELTDILTPPKRKLPKDDSDDATQYESEEEIDRTNEG